MREMEFSKEIIQDWETLTYSIGEFENNFDQYNEYCNGNATNIDCTQVGTGYTPESMLLKLEYTLNQILSNCVEGFGHLWMDHFTNLQKMMTQERFSMQKSCYEIHNSQLSIYLSLLMTMKSQICNQYLENVTNIFNILLTSILLKS